MGQPLSRRAVRIDRLLAATAVLFVSGLPLRSAHADPSTVSPEQGWDLGDVQSPRALALSGAQAAFGSSSNALFYNPANMPFSRVYHAEAMASWSPEARRQSYGAAIVDSTTSRLHGGVGGQWIQVDPDGVRRRALDLRLALAFPISDKIALGATARYLRVDQPVGRGPLGRGLISDGTADAALTQGFSVDAGVTVAPVGGLRLAVVGRNLTNPGHGLQPTNLLFGVGYGTQRFTIEANGLLDFTTFQGTRVRAMIGAEYFLADRVPLRAGYRYDDGLKTHAVSGGLGYVDRRFSIELGVRRDVVADHPSTVFGLSARLFIDSGASGADGSAF